MEELAHARGLFAQREWRAAYEAFRAADGLTAADHGALGECAHWLGRADEVLDAYGDAYHLHLEVGEKPEASYAAFMLAIYSRLRGRDSQADAWLARAHRALAGEPECAENGYPLYLETAGLMGQDLDAAVASARRMQDLGTRFADDTLVALGAFFEGRALIKQARVREGLALLDEAMLAALSDDLKPMWTGAIYCGLLDACHELGDLRRAREWTDATRQWCSPLPTASLYPGICRVHQAEMLHVAGSWADAEAQALEVCEEMAEIDVYVVADGHYEIGEIRRRRGDVVGAERAYTRAHELGRDPQPGLALLRLAQGRVDAARASIDAALAGSGGSDLELAPLLAARADIATAAGDLEAARGAATEVVEIGTRFDSATLRALGERALGAVALAQGQWVTALPALRKAFSYWNELEVPYEAARTRVLLAQVYEGLDDLDAASRECAAARVSFEQLGASADLEALLGSPAVPCGLTDRELEVLRLVATGQTNREIAGVLVISEKTVARHLANIFTKVGVSSRAAATAFAFAHGLSTAAP